MAALFLAGFGAKLGLILACSSPFPYGDQWPAEAIELFIPYLTNHYSPALLFQAHNDHRIVFTRLLELLLLVANGQWDSQLEMLVNAAIQCAGMAAFGGVLASLLGRRYWPLVWVMLALDLALPFAWENTLWGFQSQFYFLIIFSLAAIWGLGLHEANSGRWRAGAAAAILALFAMASGFLAAAAVAGLKLLETARRRENWRKQAVTLGFCGVMVGSGVLLVSRVPDYQHIHARSIQDFVMAFAKNLAWPWPLKPWYALFNILPLMVLGWRFVQGRNEPTAVERLIVGMGIWAIMQASTYAYGRGAGGMAPAWRYMDVLAFLTMANCLSLLVLLEYFRKATVRHRIWEAAFAVWLLVGAAGLWNLSSLAWRVYIPQLQREQSGQLQLAREFLATDDPGVFANKPGEQLPVLNVDADVWLLRHPLIRGILPTCSFKNPHKMGPLSIWTPRILAAWKYFLAAGIGWFLLNVIQLLRKDAPKGGNHGKHETERA